MAVFTAYGACSEHTKIERRLALLFVILIGGAFPGESNVHAQVDLWLTDPGGSARFEKQKTGLVFRTWANYFVKYIQGMKAEGIRIDAITVQNEPLNSENNPSLLMQAREQCEFVKNHLGPAFRRSGLDTRIIIYNHNCDRPDYPISILDDAEARKYVDGSAFHLYAGKIDEMSSVHEAHPDKNLYFTEQWIGAPGHLMGDLAWHTRELTIGATRNWGRTRENSDHYFPSDAEIRSCPWFRSGASKVPRPLRSGRGTAFATSDIT
jgi:hypothetical protein